MFRLVPRVFRSTALARVTADAGERSGMISFGSRVEVNLPTGVTPLVSEGQTSLAGATVIAAIGAAPQSRSFHAD
jgi:phosphatidylserine decarboxylase